MFNFEFKAYDEGTSTSVVGLGFGLNIGYTHTSNVLTIMDLVVLHLI